MLPLIVRAVRAPWNEEGILTLTEPFVAVA